MEFSTIWRQFVLYLKDIFNIYHDTDWKGAIDDIKAGIHYRGANLWTLIFAILICSVGLNVNSTAVVIGAMLISPLMGPLLGAGLALGTNDLTLFKDSARNIAIAVAISILASALYFLLTPLQEAQSELLARTRPTIFDVLVAIFGGVIGIVVSTREGYSNAIPGVAIATALMPPLCTAGYGLAQQNWGFFFGALYLFFINSLFIGLATMVVVRYLKFPQKTYIDSQTERKARYALIFIALITIVPSVYVAFNVVREAAFKQKVETFINEAIPESDNRAIIKYNSYYDPDSAAIAITMLGDTFTEEETQILQNQLQRYGLAGTHLTIKSISDNLNDEMATLNKNLRAEILKDLYLRNDSILHSKNARIKFLEDRLVQLEKDKNIPTAQILKELQINYPQITEFAFSNLVKAHDGSTDTLPVALIKVKRRLPPSQKKKIVQFLQTRINVDSLQLVTY